MFTVLGNGPGTAPVRALFGAQFELVPSCKQILATNGRPDFDVSDKAIIDRLCYIPFLARFVDEPGVGEKKLIVD